MDTLERSEHASPSTRKTISNVVYSSFALCLLAEPSPVRQSHKQFALYSVRCQCECMARNETYCRSSESKCRLAKYEKKKYLLLIFAASHRMNLISCMRIHEPSRLVQVHWTITRYLLFLCGALLLPPHMGFYTIIFSIVAGFFSTFVYSIIKVMDQMESHSRHLHLANLFLREYDAVRRQKIIPARLFL